MHRVSGGASWLQGWSDRLVSNLAGARPCSERDARPPRWWSQVSSLPPEAGTHTICHLLSCLCAMFVPLVCELCLCVLFVSVVSACLCRCCPRHDVCVCGGRIDRC